MSIFTCTACGVTFADAESQKAHYKSDWHRYNLRRKVAGLSPVDKSNFDRRLAAALGQSAPKPDFHRRCEVCRKSFKSESLYNQHLHSKKHKDAVKALAAKQATRNTSSPAPTTGGTATQDAMGTGGGDTIVAAEATTVSVTATTVNPLSGVAANTVTEVDSSAPTEVGDTSNTLASSSRVDTGGLIEESAGIQEEEDDETGDGDEGPLPPMGPCVCIFCDEVSASFEDNCAHMLREHGFFIPDVEYLIDPEGLVGYVEKKVKLGKICLYCNGKGKAFHTHRALQQHMRDRSHCKLLYEDEDMHEYEAFYDFSASYNNAETHGLLKDGDSPSDHALEEEEEDDDLQLSRTLGVTDIGELVLLDGRIVGNRKWSRFYKQHLRAVDSREVAVAQRKATSLRLGAMYDAEMGKGMSTGGAVMLQRGERKAYGGLSGVSRPKDVKMLRAHQRREAKEKLKTGLRQNKLNKTFDRVSDM